MERRIKKSNRQEKCGREVEEKLEEALKGALEIIDEVGIESVNRYNMLTNIYDQIRNRDDIKKIYEELEELYNNIKRTEYDMSQTKKRIEEHLDKEKEWRNKGSRETGRIFNSNWKIELSRQTQEDLLSIMKRLDEGKQKMREITEAMNQKIQSDEKDLKIPITKIEDMLKKENSSIQYVKEVLEYSEFTTRSYEIICGELKGHFFPYLYERKSKCIKYNKKWIRPNQFVKIATGRYQGEPIMIKNTSMGTTLEEFLKTIRKMDK